MNKKDSVNVNFASFWQNYGKLVFCGLCLICLALVLTYCPNGNFILFIGCLTAVITYYRLQDCNVSIKSSTVRFGWAVLQMTVLLFFTSVVTLEKDGFEDHLLGFIIGSVAGTIIYSCSSIVSYYLKLNDEKNGKDNSYINTKERTRFNGAFGWFVTYGIMTFFVCVTEGKNYDNHLFQKTEYVKVISWDKEIKNGNTVYIVNTAKGRFAISPYIFPKIRDINPNTEIKVLCYNTYRDDCPNVKRLEIKN